MTQAPAGWYADPSLPSRLRYWDGAAWTEHVAEAQPTPVPAGGKRLDDGSRLGGWWARGLALLLDTIVVGVVSNLVALPGQIQLQRDIQGAMDDFERSLDAGNTVDFGPLTDAYAQAFRDNFGWFLLGALVGLAYYVVMVRWRGATLGKLALGLRVRPARADGPVSWGRAVARALAIYIPNLIFILSYMSGEIAIIMAVLFLISVYAVLDLLWASWDRRSQTLHDKIAGTVVVRTR